MRRVVDGTPQQVKTNPKDGRGRGGGEGKHGNDSLKAQEWLVSNSEATIARLQSQVATLTHGMAMLRIENHVLRVKNGQVQQEVIVGGKDDGDDERTGSLASGVRQSLLEWSDIAAVLQSMDEPDELDELDVQVARRNHLFVFCHEMMVWSVQRWIRGRSRADLMLDGPHRLLREVMERDQAWCTKRVDSIVGFMESMVGVHSMRGGLEEIVRLVLNRWWQGTDEAGSLAGVFLDKFVSSDVIRCTLLMREACMACSRGMERLVKDVLGVTGGTERAGTPTEPYEPYDANALLDLMWVCDGCIYRLGTIDHSVAALAVDEVVLRDVASDVLDISQHCEVVAGILPDVALAGKRLQCQLVAALQRMESG